MAASISVIDQRVSDDRQHDRRSQDRCHDDPDAHHTRAVREFGVVVEFVVRLEMVDDVLDGRVGGDRHRVLAALDAHRGTRPARHRQLQQPQSTGHRDQNSRDDGEEPGPHAGDVGQTVVHAGQRDRQTPTAGTRPPPTTPTRPDPQAPVASLATSPSSASLSLGKIRSSSKAANLRSCTTCNLAQDCRYVAECQASH